MPNPQPNINPGLIHHSIDTSNGKKLVSQGYLPSALLGVAGGLISTAGAFALLRSKNTAKLKQMIIDNSVKGAVIGTALNEIKRRKMQHHRREDQPAFDALMMNGFKPATNKLIQNTSLALKATGSLLDSQYNVHHDGGLDNIDKNASDLGYDQELLRIKMNKDANDEAIGEVASATITPLMVYSYLAGPAPKPITAMHSFKNSAGLGSMPAIFSDSKKSGTTYLSPEEFKNAIKNKQMTKQEIESGARMGGISLDPGDLSPSSIAREVERASLRVNSKAPILSGILNKLPVKILGSVNTGYGFIADKDDRLADAAAIAQAAAYAPRTVEDIRSVMNSQRKFPNLLASSKGKQIPYLLARALPGLMPLLGRLWKKSTDS